VDTKSKEILSVHTGKGSQHDFKLFKDSRIAIDEDVTKRADLGYQGIDRIYKNTIIPHKKSKNNPLTEEQKKENKESAQIRIVVEHVNRRCKIFRIVKEVFRGKHKNYHKTWNCVAGLVNMRWLMI
jgi:IS5 family transposase